MSYEDPSYDEPGSFEEPSSPPQFVQEEPGGVYAEFWQPAPYEDEVVHAPEPVYQDYAPEPVYQDYAPEPVYQDYAPEPVYQDYAPEPVYQDYAPEQTYQEFIYVAPPPDSQPTPVPPIQYHIEALENHHRHPHPEPALSHHSHVSVRSAQSVVQQPSPDEDRGTPPFVLLFMGALAAIGFALTVVNTSGNGGGRRF